MRIPFVTRFGDLRWDLPQGEWCNYELDFRTSTSQENSAGVAIQALFRGAYMRRKLASVRLQRTLKKAVLALRARDSLENAMQACAAVAIQSQYRGLLLRKQFKAARAIQSYLRSARLNRKRREILRRVFIEKQIDRFKLQQTMQTKANLRKDHCTMCISGMGIKFVVLLRPNKHSSKDLYAAASDVCKHTNFKLDIRGRYCAPTTRKLYKMGVHAGGVFLVKMHK